MLSVDKIFINLKWSSPRVFVHMEKVWFIPFTSLIDLKSNWFNCFERTSLRPYEHRNLKKSAQAANCKPRPRSFYNLQYVDWCIASERIVRCILVQRNRPAFFDVAIIGQHIVLQLLLQCCGGKNLCRSHESGIWHWSPHEPLRVCKEPMADSWMLWG